MINEQIEEFNNYIKNYDLNEEPIKFKYDHTFRVVAIARKIVADIDIDENTKKLALIASLLHDISRFKQWSEYKTYNDETSFDHGNMSYEILKENNYIEKYVSDKKEQDIILNAVAKHNKRYLESVNDIEYDFVARVVRDADKIDILKTQYIGINDPHYRITHADGEVFETIITDALIDDILRHEPSKNENVKTYFDGVIRSLGFLFDINFKKTFEIVKEDKIIEQKIDYLRKYVNNPKIDLIEQEINKYIDEKIGDDNLC